MPVARARPLRLMARDLVATVRLVWSADPWHTGLLIATSAISGAIPAATLWVGKLMLDAVAAAVAGQYATPEDAYSQLVVLVAWQIALGAAALASASVAMSARELLGDTVEYQIRRRVLIKAAALEVADFENAETYDELCRANTAVGRRPL